LGYSQFSISSLLPVPRDILENQSIVNSKVVYLENEKTPNKKPNIQRLLGHRSGRPPAGRKLTQEKNLHCIDP
jgi:hypothetical protein